MLLSLKKYFPISTLIILLILPVSANSQNTNTIEQNLALAEEYYQAGNKVEAAALFNQSAYLLRNNNQTAEAILYYKKVLEINKELNNANGLLKTHVSLAEIYLETEQYNLALEHLNKQLSFDKTRNSPTEYISVLTNIATSQSELSQFPEALKSIETATKQALELNNLTYIKKCYGVYSDIYRMFGNSEKEQEYFDMYSAVDKKIKDERMAHVETEAAQKVNQANTEKAITEKQLDETSKVLQKTTSTLEEVEQISREQQMEIELKKSQLLEQEARLRIIDLKKRYYATGFTIVSIFVMLLLYMLWQIRKANKKINQQKFKLEKQNIEIKASIRYAKTIQTAILPDLNSIKKYFDPFIFYQPKDIVSGDFYWFCEDIENDVPVVYFAVVDCTGHGVPGAFMSMIGSQLLTEIVKERKVNSPAAILELLNTLIRSSLRQDQTDNNDGMDLSILKLIPSSEKDSYSLIAAGAKRPLYLYQTENKKLEVFNGDRKSIGGHQDYKKNISFTEKSIKVSKNDNLYLFSDGILDQNSANRKKFGRKRLEDILLSSANDSMERQKLLVENQLNLFMNNEDQRDDITLVGLKIL